MTVAFAGIVALAPTAVITPFEKTMVPFGMGAEETGTIVALRMAMVDFLPGLLMITDWAESDPAMTKASNAPASRRRSSQRAAGATLATSLRCALLIGHLGLRFVALAGFLLVLRFVVGF